MMAIFQYTHKSSRWMSSVHHIMIYVNYSSIKLEKIRKTKNRFGMKEDVRVSCSVVSDSLQPTDYRPPGSSVLGIFQARILE